MKTNPEINIRRMQEVDLPFCAKMVHQAGWNQINTDWERLMTLDPEGCFVVEVDDQKAATIVFTRFDLVAWISMVLVAVGFRGRGIGLMIFGHVIERLNSENIRTIRLDATDMGVNLYRKYGFHREYELVRLVSDQVQQEINTTGQPVAKDHHFKEQRRFMRMCSGHKIEDQPTNIFASFGPEKG